MIKSFSFIVLTHFFQFNELKILRQPGYLLFKVKPSIFFTVELSIPRASHEDVLHVVYQISNSVSHWNICHPHMLQSQGGACCNSSISRAIAERQEF